MEANNGQEIAPAPGYRLRHRWRTVLAIAVLLAAGLILVLVIGPGTSRKVEKGATSSPKPPLAPGGSGAAEAVSTPPPADYVAAADLGAIRRDALEGSTAMDLIEKGFPPVSAPRREVVEHTAAQSLEETVADMGNLMSLALSSLHVNSSFELPLCEIQRFQRTSHHPKVLRVIEAGRDRPKYVASLAKAQIEAACASYKDAFDAQVNDMGRTADGSPPRGGGISIDDEYLKKHGRYENPGFEFQRLNEQVYACFYVLANINELTDRDLLAKWQRLPRGGLNGAFSMDIWLIDQYIKQAGLQDSPFGRRHAELTRNAGLDAGFVERSRWNASWDKEHSLLKAREVNPRDIPTIRVLQVPKNVHLSPKRLKETLINIHKYIGKVPGP